MKIKFFVVYWKHISAKKILYSLRIFCPLFIIYSSSQTLLLIPTATKKKKKHC